MSKQRSSVLFALVKSLSKSEKRYFKLAQLSPGDKKFIRLFEMIDAQEVFDEDLILQSETSFDPIQFSNLKAHLYSKILKSLRDYSLSSMPSIEIRELIDEAQILFNKSLYTQSVKRLEKAEKLAIATDNLEQRLVIFKWQKRLLNHMGGDNQELAEQLVERVKDVNERINLINILSNLQTKLQSLYRRKGYVRNERDFIEIEKIFQSNLPAVQEASLSITERIYLYQLYIGYYFHIQDFESGSIFARKWVEIFKNQKTLQRVGLDSYISALNYLLIAQNKLERYREFQETKKELRTLNKLHPSLYNENIRLKMFKYTFVHEFNGFFLAGDFERGVELFERLQSGVERFAQQLDAHSRVIFFYKTACLYFGNSEFKKAIFWLNKILTSKEFDLREDIHGFARILNLICHYEMGNIDLIEYSVRSTYRYLLKRKELLEYQKLILNFLKSLKFGMTAQELKVRFSQLKTRMLTIQENPYERGFVYFDMVSWLESKITSRAIGAIIKEKAQSRMNEMAIP